MTDYTQLMLAQLAPQFAATVKPRDPYGPRRAFGMSALQQGMSTKPVSGVVEGLARALQGGVGGYIANRANEDQDAEDKGNASALAAALQSVDKDGNPDIGAITAALARNPNMAPMAAMLQTANVMQRRGDAQGRATADMITGRPPGGGAGILAPPQAGAAPSGAGGPGPITANNPGNIIDGQGGFRQYASPDEGVAALIRNAQAYPGVYNGGRPMTIAQIGQHWAPKDNRGTDPVAWARAVAQISGLPPDQPLDLTNPQVAIAFARGVHGIEKGQGAAFPPEVYQRAGQTVLGGRPPPAAAPPVAIPPQAAPPPLQQAPGLPPPQPVPLPPRPQMGAAPPIEGAGIDDSGEGRPAPGGFDASPTVKLQPPVRFDDGSREMAIYKRWIEAGAPEAQRALALKYYDTANDKALKAQQAQADAQGKEPPMMGRTDQGGVAMVDGALKAISDKAAAGAAGSGAVDYFTDEKGSRWERNRATGAMKPAPEPDRTTIVTGAGGYPVQKDNTGKETAIAGPGVPFNEGQGKAAGFADRMRLAGPIIDKLETSGLDPQGRLLESLGIVGNYAQSSEYRQYVQARDNLIAAQLRRESGAKIEPSEYDDAFKQYMPRPGDDKAVLAQKRSARQALIDAMVREAGPAYKPTDAAPAAPAAKGDPLPNHVDALRSNPGLAPQFDQTYGPGASERYLKGGR